MLTERRLFVAITIPPAVRRAVVDATTAIRDAAPEPAWIPESRLHLTLKFLGPMSDERALETERTIAAVAALHRPIDMRLRSVGAFPNFRRARVVWFGIDPDPRLELLHHDIELGCSRLGFELEGRPFRPHITLARVKTPMSTDRLRVMSRGAKRVDYEADVPVRSVELMTSHLSPSGPTYATVASADLRSH